MMMEGNAMERHQMEAAVLLGSLVSRNLFAIYSVVLFKSVKGSFSTDRQSLGDDLDWVATTSDVDQVVPILDSGAAKSIPWAS